MSLLEENPSGYFLNLPIEIERRLRENSREVFPLHKYGYMTWQKIATDGRTIYESPMQQYPKVKLYIFPQGNGRFSVETVTYDDAGIPRERQQGIIVILNEFEAQLTDPLPLPWDIPEGEARLRLKNIGVGSKRMDRMLKLRKDLITGGVIDRYSLSEKDNYDKDRQTLKKANLLPPGF